LEKRTVLIVDDEPLNIKTIHSLLKDNYTIKVANSGERALKVVENEFIDLILLDIMMPEMDGFEVAKRLKSNPKTAKIEIIFITAKHDNETIVNGFKLGAVDFVSKPFSKEELLMRIDTHMENLILKAQINEKFKSLAKQLEIIDNYVIYSKTDLDGIITFASQAYTTFSGYEKKFLIGKNHNIVKSCLTPKEVFADLWCAIETRNETWQGEIINRKKSGEIYYIKSKISPDFDQNGKKIGYIGFYEDITDKKTIEKLAQTDHLTKLFNRQKIDEFINIEIDRSRRYQSPLSLIMLDIDFFKIVNDTYGHDVGDTVLKEFSGILVANSRRTDFVGRFGGEEFLIVAPETTLENAFQLGEKLRKAVSDFNFSVVGHKTVSVGVTIFKSEDKPQEFLKRVDEALYLAKNSGRDRVEKID
jgi:diguanylate cyclase (GGDEF)-like protein/PAS domain S-box-containing protein